mmetsp:Transcript_3786/g.5286  ORF Transcript_3786/g.5286 Transcript_3786/m.5286 type:complete len:247 (-) Transcript_3786:46-786(-)
MPRLVIPKRFFSSIPNTNYAKRVGLIEEKGATARKFIDSYNKHRSTSNLGQKRALIGFEVFIAPSAAVIGKVELWENSSVWYDCTVKGDLHGVRIGAFTNIQDGTQIHEALEPLSAEHDGSTIIGHHVTIGPGCVLKGCTIEDGVFVGMGSVLEEGSYMEAHSILGAGSVLSKGSRVPSGELWQGNPAKLVRKLYDDDLMNITMLASNTAAVARAHLDEYYLDGDAYQDAEKQGIKVGWTIGESKF